MSEKKGATRQSFIRKEITTYRIGTLIWCPIFDSSPLIQNSKFNNFLWVCWFLCKNLTNFVSPVWKLHNPYCHNIHDIHIIVFNFRKKWWWRWLRRLAQWLFIVNLWRHLPTPTAHGTRFDEKSSIWILSIYLKFYICSR